MFQILFLTLIYSSKLGSKLWWRKKSSNISQSADVLVLYDTVTGILSEQATGDTFFKNLPMFNMFTNGSSDINLNLNMNIITKNFHFKPACILLCLPGHYSFNQRWALQITTFWYYIFRRSCNQTYPHWVYWLSHYWTWSVSQDECCSVQDTAGEKQHLGHARYPTKHG